MAAADPIVPMAPVAAENIPVLSRERRIEIYRSLYIDHISYRSENGRFTVYEKLAAFLRDGNIEQCLREIFNRYYGERVTDERFPEVIDSHANPSKFFFFKETGHSGTPQCKEHIFISFGLSMIVKVRRCNGRFEMKNDMDVWVPMVFPIILSNKNKSLKREAMNQIKALPAKGTTLKNRVALAELQAKLTKAEAILKGNSTDLECGICSERMKNPTTLECGHSFCMADIKSWMLSQTARGEAPTCPVCRMVITKRPEDLKPNTVLKSMVNRRGGSRRTTRRHVKGFVKIKSRR
jgi:hypothetical protein